jgi:hypothetical protein
MGTPSYLREGYQTPPAESVKRYKGPMKDVHVWQSGHTTSAAIDISPKHPSQASVRQQQNVRLGQKPTYAPQYVVSALLPIATAKADMPQMVMSALPLKADVCGANHYVSFGPKADICARQDAPPTPTLVPATRLPFAVNPRIS